MPRRFALLSLLFLLVALPAFAAGASDKPNLLIITVDDMSADSIGVFGCPVAETTPNIDRLAAEGLRFTKAHVQVGNCMPSRNVMWSGRYPHNNGVEGFYQVRDIDYPTLGDLLKEAGYYTGIRHKIGHSTPYSPYPAWDIELDTLPDGSQAHTKDAKSYGESVERGIANAKAEGKPFYLLINISDPHKPFYAQGKNGETIPDPHVPSKVFTPEEMVTPGFLFEDPVVAKELSHYYSSVRRADDGVGCALKALKESGELDDTIIVFLSDHGMALPFAKTQVYHHSTNTPLIVLWPGVTKAGAIDEKHMVAAVDLTPTLIDVLGLRKPEGMDGRSFAPLLRGETQADRDFIVKEYNENAGASRDPMRAIQTERLLYIFNPWSNGERIMATATTGTPTYRRMAELAKTDDWIAARHDLYQHRVVEELYDIQKDPDCLVNLIAEPAEQENLAKLRETLEAWMVRTNDHALQAFRNRDDPEAREAYVLEKEAESAARRAAKQKPASPKAIGLISFLKPGRIQPTETVTIAIQHKLPADLEEQQIHVTLKDGDAKRIERQVLTISGEGTLEVTFDMPEQVNGDAISFAAFVGKDFESSLQHVTTRNIAVK